MKKQKIKEVKLNTGVLVTQWLDVERNVNYFKAEPPKNKKYST
jgi:hypothetical protein